MTRRLSSRLVDGFFANLSGLGQRTRLAREEIAGVDRLRDIPYRSGGSEAHLLDVWRPKGPTRDLPAVFYVHGGGFSALSKDTHWIMALAYARAGYVVFNINYRLAPEHRFPAGLQDVFAAYRWVVQHAAEYGADPRRIGVAGESAGANLIVSLLVACCFDRPEPWAQPMAELPIPISASPMCGMFQVSDPHRLWRQRWVDPLSRSTLLGVTESYLGRGVQRGTVDLADPLLVLEGGAVRRRSLPPIFLGVGTWDPLHEDHVRLTAALRGRSTPVVSKYYPREPHAFHALVVRRGARQCWADLLGFAARASSPVAE